MPRDLFPEWTTRPHAVHAKPSAVLDPPRTRPPVAAPRSQRLWLLAIVLLGAVAVALFVGRDRFQLRSPPHEDPTLQTPDAQLQEMARARVAREPELRGADVTVVVREQVATVSGRVPTIAAREKALNVVRMTPNVTGVIDHLSVGDPGKPDRSEK